MTKKEKRKTPIPEPKEVSPKSVISKRGWKIIGGGLVVVILGYIVLSFTDPQGQNAASHISPYLILGGYVLIGFGIMAKDTLPE